MPAEGSWTPLPGDLNITQRGNVKDYVVCRGWLMHIGTYAGRIRAEPPRLFLVRRGQRVQTRDVNARGFEWRREFTEGT